MTQPTAGIESDLIDLAEVALADLPTYHEETLAPTMRRLLSRIDVEDLEQVGPGGAPDQPAPARAWELEGGDPAA